MATPIVVDGTTSIIIVNTRLLVNPIVQLPPLNLIGRLFTIVDTGGKASTNPITINMIGGATLDGKTTVLISTDSGSISFSQTTDSKYISAQTVIRGNILQGPPRIIISTGTTVFSSITSQSSLVVYSDFCTQKLNLGGRVYALNGFQPTPTNPYVTIDYLSAITVSTQSIDIGKIVGGSLNTSNIIASSIFVSSFFNTNSLDSINLNATSTFVGGLSLNGQPLYSYQNNLYLNNYKINNDINFLVPQFTSSIQGLVSSLNFGPGISSLSTTVGLLSSVYNPNPGLSSLSTYNASRIPLISGADTSTVYGLFSSGLSTVNAVPGLSSLSTVISRGLSSITLPFNLSSLLIDTNAGLSSVFEGVTLSTLNIAISRGLSSVNQNSGIDQLTTNTSNQLSTTATSVLFSSISTQLGYGYSTINASSLTNSIFQNASTSFSNLSLMGQISSFSSILEATIFNIRTSQGLSSLSTTIGHGFNSIDIRAPVSSLSTSMALGISSVSTFSLQASSLSTSITLQLSTLLDRGISSLLNDINLGSSIVFAAPGISSFSQYQSTSFFNMITSQGLSSLSTTLVLGLSTVIRNIVPSSQITFSSINASSLSLYKSGTNYGSLVVNNNFLYVNGHAPTPPDNNFETASSISTYRVFVGSTTTSFVTIYPSSLTIMNFLTTSSIYTTKILTESTIIGTLNFKDALTNNINEIRPTADQDILLNGKSLFLNENIGLSSLSTLLGPAISSISSFVETINAISTGFSTIGPIISRISSLSSLFGNRVTPGNVSTGVSTIFASISTLVTSTLSVQYLNIFSTFASTVNTSSLEANIVSGLFNSSNAYFIASTISVGQSYVSSFPIGIQVSSVSTNSLSFGLLNTTNLKANVFFASTVMTNTAYGSTVFLKDNGASYNTARPLEFSTFYPLYGNSEFLIYNSTIYGGKYSSDYKDGFSTNFLTVNTIGSGVIHTSTIHFTGKVQFDRLVVMQKKINPLFVALETGYTSNATAYNAGRLYVSPDGITWSNVDTTDQPSWVGKSNTGAYPSGTQPRLAWNGEYFIAWTTSSNTTNQNANGALSNNAISYNGVNWSNVNRRSAGQTAATANPLTSIVWTGETWIKTNRCVQNINIDTNEQGDAISRDGINWSRTQWSSRSEGTLSLRNNFIMNEANTATQQQGYSLFYNGTTLVNYPSGTAGNSVAFSYSHDLVNIRPTFSNMMINNSIDYTAQSGDTPRPWSDGYAWWFPNTCNATDMTGGLYRIYAWQCNTDSGGIGTAQLTDNTQVLKQCFGVGFDLLRSNTDNSMSYCGYFNGQMHVHGKSMFWSAAGRPAILSSLSLVYSYDGIYFFPSPSVEGIRGSVRSVTYANGIWIATASGNIYGNCNSDSMINTGPTIWNSYDGMNWKPSVMIPSQVNVTGQNGLSNLQGTTSVLAGDGLSETRLGGGIVSLIYMSNLSPAMDFNGVRIYNQTGGISWNTPALREQSIHAYQSSIVLHNTIVIAGDNSVKSLVDGTNIRVGICNVNPSTTLDIGGAATVTAERLYTSSLYILPSLSTNMFSERNLPLSSFNFYVHGSTFMSRLAVNVPRPVTILDISGANALFRSQGATSNGAAQSYLTNLTDTQNAILGPSMMYNSTVMSIYYKSGGTNYIRSYGGSNFFTGQHATICLDISGALVSSITSTIITYSSGLTTTTFSTIWTDYSGYLLSSADLGYLSIPNKNLRLWGSNAINITEALPYTRITTKDKDPSVFGIVTNNANNSYNQDGSWLLDSDPLWGNDLYGRVRVNSIGEGALWVTNINGNISNGDFLCSSTVPGHARKQDEDAAYNYTVAKATMSCQFDVNNLNYVCEPIEYNGSTFLRAYIGVTYNCG